MIAATPAGRDGGRLDSISDRQIRNLGHAMDVAQSVALFRDQGDDIRDTAARVAILWVQGLIASSDPTAYRVNANEIASAALDAETKS